MDVIRLNVGGFVFETSRTTLEHSDSFFSGLVSVPSDNNNYFFVDRDPTHFRYVLNWMRGVRELPEDDAALRELAWEADFYSMRALQDAIVRTQVRVSVPRAIQNIAAALAS